MAPSDRPHLRFAARVVFWAVFALSGLGALAGLWGWSAAAFTASSAAVALTFAARTVDR